MYDAALKYSGIKTGRKVFLDQFLYFGRLETVKIKGSRYGHLDRCVGIFLAHSGKTRLGKSWRGEPLTMLPFTSLNDLFGS